MMRIKSRSSARTSFRRWILAAVAVLIAMMVAVDVFVLLRRDRYKREIERLREGMTDVERQRTDLLLASTERRTEVMVELIRRQARVDKELNLAVAVDSAVMHLQREGENLRDLPVVIGEERVIGQAPDTVRLAVPLGTRTIERLLTGRDRWEVPEMVFRDRGEVPPADRALAGALGPYAILLSGGAVIYSLPSEGPLADESYVLPGAVRASADDLRAVFINLRAGTRVYFY